MSNIAAISLTEKAKEQLKIIRENNNIDPDLGLRVGTKAGGGCSGGFTYVLGFDEMKDGDQAYEIDGITTYINKAQGLYLLGMEIDWHEEGETKGFTFNNPNTNTSEGNNFTI